MDGKKIEVYSALLSGLRSCVQSIQYLSSNEYNSSLESSQMVSEWKGTLITEFSQIIMKLNFFPDDY